MKPRHFSDENPNIPLWLLLLTLALLVPGCGDNEGYQWITVTPDSQLDKGPRRFSIELATPNWEDIWCDANGKACVAVGEGGNIKRSENDGKTWAAVSSGTQADLLTIHGEGERLVAVGNDGVIVRSVNGGKTWAAVSSGTNAGLKAIHGDGERLVAAGRNGAIVRSVDGGKTWAAVSSGTRAWLNAIHGDGERLVAVGDSGAIVRSEDGGKTWAAVSSGTNAELKAIHGHGERLVAVGGRAIVHSTDGGKTWAATVFSGTLAWLYAIHGDGERLVAVGGDGAIVRSMDSGKTWAVASSGTQAVLYSINGGGERLVAVGRDGAIVRSMDSGKTWEVVSSGTQAELYSIHGEGERLVAVGRGGAIVLSVDGGKTWAAVSSGNQAGLNAIQGDGDRLVAVGDGGAIVRSVDGGKTWAAASSGIQAELKAIQGDGDRLVAVGDGGAIVRSVDGGKTWAAASSGIQAGLYAIHGNGERLVAVGYHGAIVRSKDGGKTWAVVSSGTQAVLYSIHGDGERLVAVGNDIIVRSVDGGKTWVAAYSGILLNAIHGDGERLVAVGDAIARSEDGGKTWAVVSSNVPLLDAIHGDGERLVAVGGGGAIVRSVDDGKTWAAVFRDTDPDRALHAIHGDGERLVAVGRGDSIVRSVDGGKTWVAAAVSNVFQASLHAIHGDGEHLVAVGYDNILLINPTGPRWPVLKKLGYRSVPSIGGQLLLRFEWHDPDGLCQENNKNCTLEAMGRNETDLGKQRNLNNLPRLTRIKNTSIWEVAVNPKDFSVNPGETLHLEVLLKGPDFSWRYPIDQTAYKIPYQVDPRPVYVAIALATVASVLALLYWLTPLWLLGLYRRLVIFEAAQKLGIPGLSEGVQMALKATVLPWLITQPRVLDAWVKQNLADWTAVFEQEDAVARLHYYPLPLRRTKTRETILSPGPDDFKPDFSTPHALLQIIGAGGSGKTSFAVQLGSWALDQRLAGHVIVPVWLDEDVADVLLWLVRRVREVVRDDDLPEVFIHALFKRKRLLFIVDRLSERQASSREAMKHLPDWLTALVVNSRYEIDLGLPKVKHIETLGLDSKTVMGFIETLIQNADGRSKLSGLGIKADLAKRFAEVITIEGKEERITPLLVTLFVQKALAQYDGDPENFLDAMPASIPEVYFDYLCGVNPDDESAKNRLPREKMLLAAGVLARAELGEDFRPKRIDQLEADTALAKAGLLANGANPLQRLIDNQVVEQRQEGGGYLVSFALDPAAEFLAAFAHAQRCGKNADDWRELIEQVAKLDEQASGFMAALKITHQVYADRYGWTQPVAFPASPTAE